MKQLSTQHYVRGLAGALVGALLGYLGFKFLANSGLYAMILPGSLIGMGCGYASRVHSRVLGIIASVIGLVSSVLLEWDIAPFLADDSLGYFVTHIHQVLPAHLIMMTIGTAFAFWFGQGRERFVSSGNAGGESV